MHRKRARRVFEARVDFLAGHPDEAVFSLWSANGAGRASGTLTVYTDWTLAWQKFLAAAASVPVIAAPPGQPAEALTCAEPYVGARTLSAAPLRFPDSKTYYTGLIPVRVTIDAHGIARVFHIEKTTGVKRYDDAAVVATSESKFAAEIYRCQPVTGDYLFIAEYDPPSSEHY